jgi:hypothetical protein
MERRKTAPLMPELVPGPLWGRSAHKMLGSKAIWKKQIRGDTLAEAGNRCSVCKSSEGRMTCHETWGYDDKQLVATLLGFEIHCSNCDLVAHAGRAFKLGYGEAVISHLCAMNHWDIRYAVSVLKHAMDVWGKRSNKEWRIKVAPIVVERYPELSSLPGFVPPPISYFDS